MKTKLALIAILLVCGCSKPQQPKRNILEAKPDSFTVIHWQSAANRADIYDKIADGIKDGDLTTVEQVVDFSAPLFNEAAQKYTEDGNALRKQRLKDADDKLPKDADKIFRKMAQEYRRAVGK